MGTTMSQLQLGKIQMLSARELWRHEERDFTPWLAQNIEQLSELLGVQIVVDHIEHKVGGYELDILGHVEENEAVVIIENQLQGTDHGHLGQLITYAAGLEAALIIWIATDVRDEHRAAINWLNSNTVDKVSFFLFVPKCSASTTQAPQFVSSLRQARASLVVGLEASSKMKTLHVMSSAASSGRPYSNTWQTMVIPGQRDEIRQRILGLDPLLGRVALA